MTSTYLSPAREELAHRLPPGAQSFVTWLSGIRGSRDPAARLLSPVEVVGIGVASMAKDFGIQLSALVHTYSTAALGIVHRKGLGRTRHLDVQYLWLQEKSRR